MDDHRLEDALQSLLAQTHHIQTRLMQSACKGSISDNVLKDIQAHALAIADTSRRMRMERKT